MQVFEGELTISEKLFEELFDAKVAVVENQTVGYFTIRQHAGGITELEHLFVHPDWFGKGVGTILLRSAMEVVKERGIKKLTIIADPNSSGFYEKFGAVKVGDHKSSIAGRVIPVYELSVD